MLVVKKKTYRVVSVGELSGRKDCVMFQHQLICWIRKTNYFHSLRHNIVLRTEKCTHDGRRLIIVGNLNKYFFCPKATSTSQAWLAFVLMSKCGNNNELTLQHGGFCNMWSFVAKGLVHIQLAIEQHVTVLRATWQWISDHYLVNKNTISFYWCTCMQASFIN